MSATARIATLGRAGQRRTHAHPLRDDVSGTTEGDRPRPKGVISRQKDALYEAREYNRRASDDARNEDAAMSPSQPSRRMSAEDAFFLYFEKTHAPLHITTVAIF